MKKFLGLVLTLAMMTSLPIVASAAGKNYTGVAQQSDGNWYYFKNGVVQTSYTGIQNNQHGWWRIENGKVNFDATGVYQNENGWWRVENGKVNFNASGIFQNTYGWWRVENGKVDFTAQSIYQNPYGWWKTTNGKVTFDENGVFQNQYGWWKVTNSKVDFSFNGIASNIYGDWFIVDGKVNFAYTGQVAIDGVIFNVEKGKVTGRVAVVTDPDDSKADDDTKSEDGNIEDDTSDDRKSEDGQSDDDKSTDDGSDDDKSTDDDTKTDDGKTDDDTSTDDGKSDEDTKTEDGKSEEDTKTDDGKSDESKEIKILTSEEFLNAFSTPVEITEDNWSDYLEFTPYERNSDRFDAFGDLTGGTYLKYYNLSLKNAILNGNQENSLSVRFRVTYNESEGYQYYYEDDEKVLTLEEIQTGYKDKLTYPNSRIENLDASFSDAQNNVTLTTTDSSIFYEYIENSSERFVIGESKQITDVSFIKAKGSVIPYSIDDSYWNTNEDGDSILYVSNKDALYCINMTDHRIDEVNEDTMEVIEEDAVFCMSEENPLQVFYKFLMPDSDSTSEEETKTDDGKSEEDTTTDDDTKTNEEEQIKVKYMTEDQFLAAFSQPVRLTSDNFYDYFEFYEEKSEKKYKDSEGNITRTHYYKRPGFKMKDNVINYVDLSVIGKVTAQRGHIEKTYEEGETRLTPSEIKNLGMSTGTYNDATTTWRYEKTFNASQRFVMVSDQLFECINDGNTNYQYIYYNIEETSISSASGIVQAYNIDDSYWETDENGNRILYVLKDGDLHCINLDTKTVNVVDSNNPSIIDRDLINNSMIDQDILASYYEYLAGPVAFDDEKTDDSETYDAIKVKYLSKDEFLDCFSEPTEIQTENFNDYFEVSSIETHNIDKDSSGNEKNSGVYEKYYYLTSKDCILDSDQVNLKVKIKYRNIPRYEHYYYQNNEEAYTFDQIFQYATERSPELEETTENTYNTTINKSSDTRYNGYFFYPNQTLPTFYERVSYDSQWFYVSGFNKQIDSITVVESEGTVLPYDFSSVDFEYNENGEKVFHVLDDDALYRINLDSNTFERVDKENTDTVIETIVTADSEDDIVNYTYNFFSN